MEPDRYMLRCAVHLLLINNGKVLVEKRKNREYCDGQYDLIASHILGNEDVYSAIIRTAKTEVNIEIKKEDLEIIQVMHQKSEDYEYINYFFVTNKYTGILNNNEPEFCEKLEWVELKYPIDNMMEYINFAIEKYIENSENKFTIMGFGND